jgi:hypothetical protein
VAATPESGDGGGGFGGGSLTRAEERAKLTAARAGGGCAGDGKSGRRCGDDNQAAAQPIPAATWTAVLDRVRGRITAATGPRRGSVGSGEH